MIEIKFNRNDELNFLKVVTFSVQKKIPVFDILKQAYDQNVLIDNEKKVLSNFIDYIRNIKNSRSQLLQDIFASFVIYNNFSKTFLEFGATNGVELSNTYMLENELGWSGLLSEPDPQWINDLKKNRPNSKITTKCIWKKSNETMKFFSSNHGFLSTLDEFKYSDKESMPGNVNDRIKKGKNVLVETISLNDLIVEKLNGVCPSYISIDTEGSEFEILNSFNFSKYRPAVFTVEHNFTKCEKDIDKIMMENNYIRIFRNLTAFDAWYVSKDAHVKLIK